MDRGAGATHSAEAGADELFVSWKKPAMRWVANSLTWLHFSELLLLLLIRLWTATRRCCVDKRQRRLRCAQCETCRAVFCGIFLHRMSTLSWIMRMLLKGLAGVGLVKYGMCSALPNPVVLTLMLAGWADCRCRLGLGLPVPRKACELQQQHAELYFC